MTMSGRACHALAIMLVSRAGMAAAMPALVPAPEEVRELRGAFELTAETVVLSAEAEFRQGFDTYVAFLRAEKATDLMRLGYSATECSPIPRNPPMPTIATIWPSCETPKLSTSPMLSPASLTTAVPSSSSILRSPSSAKSP